MQSSGTCHSSCSAWEILSPGHSPMESVPPGESPPPPFLTPLATPGRVAQKQRQQFMPALHGSNHFGRMLRLLVADLHRLSTQASLVEEAWALNEAIVVVDGSAVDFPHCHTPRVDNLPSACSGDAATVNLPTCLATNSPNMQNLGKPAHEETETSAKPFTIRPAWCDFADDALVDYKRDYTETFSRLMLLRRQTLRMHSGALLKSNTMASLLTERFVLHPSGKPRIFWNMVCLAFIVYDILAIPMMVFPISEYVLFASLDWMCTICWSIDIAIEFRTGYFAGSHLQMRPLQIAKHYLKSWMVPDLLIVGSMWFSALYDDNLVGGRSALRSLLRVLRAARLVRIAKMKHLWTTIENLVQSGMLHLMCGVVKLTALLLFIVHVITCLWFATGDSTGGWITHYSPESPRPEDDVFFWYSASTRWTLAQINGRTDMEKNLNMPELVYTCIVAFAFAVIFMAIFISSITTMMMDLATLVEHKTSLQRTVRNYLKRQPVSSRLVGNVHHSLAQEYEKENRVEEETKVLGALPQQLAHDLVHEVRMSVLLGYEWFAAMNPEFPRSVRHLCHAASDLLCVHRGEVVFERGDACKRMLFVDQGRVLYDTDAIQHTGTGSFECNSESSSAQRGLALRRGEWLSEAALWVEWINQGRLTAGSNAGFTWLIAVNMQEFATTTRQYEAAYAMSVIFAQQFVERLEKVELLSDLAMPYSGRPNFEDD